MLTIYEVTEIFYLCDEFSKEFEFSVKKHLMESDNTKKRRNRPNRMSESEVMTILIAFHLSGMCNNSYYSNAYIELTLI